MPYIGNPAVVGDSTNNFKLLDDIQSFTVTFDATDTSIVSISGNTLTFRNHRFLTGQRVTYNDGGGTAIGGLADGVYFIIKVDKDTIQLATNASNAASSTAIDLTSGAAGGSHTLNVAFDGVNTKFSATHSSGTRAGVSRAGQISLSINGVIQQPQDTGSPTTGYGVLPDSIIIFSTPPASVDKVFGTFIGEVAASFDLTDNTVDNFTGDGSTTTFNLSRDVPSSNDVLVTLDGVTQYPTDSSTVRSYSVIESTLTFVSAPDTGVAIQVRHIGFAGATTSAVTGFYGRQGNVALTSTDDISVQNVSAGIITATKFVGVNSMTDLFVSGITSFTNATDSTSSTTGSVIVSGGVGIAGSLNVGGSVSVGGTLTYEDVTNIDAVGLITARAGVVVGSGITLSKDGDIFATGVCTATSFVGSGANLTGVASTENIRTNTNATFLQNVNVSGTSTIGGDVNIADKIVHIGDTDTAIRFASADTITAETGGSERVRINSDGRVLVNATTARNVGGSVSRMVEVESAGGGAGISIVRNQNSASPPTLDLGKSRGYPHTIVQADDKLGIINFAGADGTDLVSVAAQISGEVDGTPGADDMPGRLVFKTTADGASSPTERLRITSDGKIGIGGAPAYTLDLGESSSTIRLVSESNGTAIRMGAGGTGNDFTLLRVDGTSGQHDGESDDSAYGFSLKYMGSRTGANNSFSLFSDNNDGTAIEAITIEQDGKIGINNTSPSACLLYTSDAADE